MHQSTGLRMESKVCVPMTWFIATVQCQAMLCTRTFDVVVGCLTHSHQHSYSTVVTHSYQHSYSTDVTCEFDSQCLVHELHMIYLHLSQRTGSWR